MNKLGLTFLILLAHTQPVEANQCRGLFTYPLKVADWLKRQVLKLPQSETQLTESWILEPVASSYPIEANRIEINGPLQGPVHVLPFTEETFKVRQGRKLDGSVVESAKNHRVSGSVFFAIVHIFSDGEHVGQVRDLRTAIKVATPQGQVHFTFPPQANTCHTVGEWGGEDFKISGICYGPMFLLLPPGRAFQIYRDGALLQEVVAGETQAIDVN